MKRHISIFVCFALALSAKASTPSVMLIADRALTVPYVQDNGSDPAEIKLVDQRGIGKLNLDLYAGEYYGEVLGGATFTAPDIPGCQFDGWYTFAKNVNYDDTSVTNCNEMLTTEKQIGSTMYTKSARTSSACYNDYVLCLKYSYIPLTVSFNGNGATSGTTDPVTDKNYDSEFKLPKNGFVRTGYSFASWTNAVGKVFTDEQSVKGADFWNTSTKNFSAALTAQWMTNPYTITYDLAGGTSAGGPNSAKYGEVFELLHPTKAGSQFNGWKVVEGLNSTTAKYGSTATSVNSSISSADTLCKGSGNSTFFLNISAAKNGAVKLQAVWVADGYTVTFDNQGADSGKGGISTMTVEYNVKPRDLASNEIPFKTGNDFIGYYEEQGSMGEQHWNKYGVYQLPSWPYTSGKTLYAGWKAHGYSISYVGLEDVSDYPTSAAYGEIFALARPAKTGYKFTGWNVTAGLASKDAKYGESTELVNRSIDYSWTKIIASDENPTGTVYIRNLNTNDNAQVTLRANWAEAKYKATFEIAGANNNPTREVEVTYDEVLPNVTTVPTYESGEIFRGYFTEPNGLGEKYWNANGTPAKEKWTVTGDLKLYECKTGFDYYITYDANGGEGAVPQQSCNSSNDVTLASGKDLHRSGFHLCGWDFNKDNLPEKCQFRPSQTVSFSDLKVKEDGDKAVLFAIWQDKHVRIAIDATGGTAYTNGVKVTSLTYVDGEKYGFLPDAVKQHYVFVGWFTQVEGGDPVTEDSTVDFATVKTLYAHWTPERFFVAFDGNGATNAGAMAVQEFVWDEEKALSQNLYGRIGYTFGGWATNTVTMKKVFDDCQVVSNLVGTADATQTVFAVWNTNAYHVAFSANGGTGPLPETIPCQYDHLVTIPAPSADLVKPPFLFSGWRDPVADVVYTNLPAVVSNLCDVADGTNTLFAVWKLSDLSEAMHCTNLYWESVTNLWHSSKIEWAGAYGEGEGFEGSGSCVRQPALSEVGIPQMLTAKLAESGTLSFRWKGTTMAFNISKKRDDTEATSHRLASGADEWNYFSTNLVVTAETWVHIYNYTPNSAADIDQMTWTPKGSEPKQGEPIRASAAGVEDGVFSLTIPTEIGTDYGVWTNADLTVPAESWGLMETKKADGETLDFSFGNVPGVPQLFFRAYKVK